MYWNSKTTSRCRNCCVFYGTWFWAVKNLSDMNDSPFFLPYDVFCHINSENTHSKDIHMLCLWATTTRQGHRKASQQIRTRNMTVKAIGNMGKGSKTDPSSTHGTFSCCIEFCISKHITFWLNKDRPTDVTCFSFCSTCFEC